MHPCPLAVSILGALPTRLLPDHLDLFTACDGGAGIGGILGGAFAVATDRDIARSGVMGGVIGLLFASIVVILATLRVQ